MPEQWLRNQEWRDSWRQIGRGLLNDSVQGEQSM